MKQVPLHGTSVFVVSVERSTRFVAYSTTWQGFGTPRLLPSQARNKNTSSVARQEQELVPSVRRKKAR